MFALTPSFRTALLALAALAGTGCTHFANVTQVASDDGVPTYVSSRSWDDGTPRTIVTERVFERPQEACHLVQVQRDFFDQTGALRMRQTDFETCDVVQARVTEDHDPRAGQVKRVVQRDADRDGMFEEEHVVSGYEGMREIASLLGAGSQ